MALGRHTDYLYTPLVGDKVHIVANDTQHAINILRKCYIREPNWTAHTDKDKLTTISGLDGVVIGRMIEGKTWVRAEGY